MQLVWQGIHFKAFHEKVEVAPGKVRTFEHVWRIDGTRTIATRDSTMLLSREFRHELGREDWRLPGGKLDFEGEDILSAAARELREETGITAKTWQHLWTTSPDATVRFKRHFLLAEDITESEQELGEGEKITTHWLTYKEVIKLALSAQVAEEISALAIIRFCSERG